MDIKKFYLILFSVVFSLIVVELGLRLVNFPYIGCEQVMGPEETHFGQFDQETGWSWQSNLEHQGQYDYYFNQDGIRIPSPEYEFDLDKPTIMFIGGSVTFGYAIDYADTFPGQIKELLDSEFEVINLGVQGFGTDQTYLLMERYIDKYSPEIIVYTFIPGHIQRNITYDRRLHFNCLFFPGSKPLYQLEDNKAFLARSPVKTQIIDRFRSRLLIDLVGQLITQQFKRRSGQDIKITQAFINKIHQLSQKNQSLDLYVFYDNYVDNQYLKKNLFDDQNLPVQTFYKFFKGKDRDDQKWYVDEYHPTPELNKEIAERFINKYQKELAGFVEDK
jgi:hypothetical protein